MERTKNRTPLFSSVAAGRVYLSPVLLNSNLPYIRRYKTIRLPSLLELQPSRPVCGEHHERHRIHSHRNDTWLTVKG